MTDPIGGQAFKQIDGKPRVSSIPFLYDVAEGNVSDLSCWMKIGYNGDVDAGTEDMIAQGGVYVFPAAGCPPSNSHYRTRGNGAYSYNGIDRVDNNKGYILENVVPCCKRCNYMKREMGQEDFISHIERIFNNLGLARCRQSDMLNDIKELQC